MKPTNTDIEVDLIGNINALLDRIRTLHCSGNDDQAACLRKTVLQTAEEGTKEDFIQVAEYFLRNREQSWIAKSNASARQFYTHLMKSIEERLGTNHLLFAKAGFNLATVYAFSSCWEEAVSLAQMALGIQEGALGRRDREVINTIMNIEIWLENLSRQSEADALKHDRWARFPICEHLWPLENYILSAGGKVTGRGEVLGDRGVSEFVDVYLDGDSLIRRMNLDACIKPIEIYDCKMFNAKGFYCEVHDDQIWGYHPKDVQPAITVS